ncbi:hypothetical protein D9757_001412 [Collybiopsis confluens]|uniref:Zf-C3HC-domain-containing protein n=1 Tax=Collybiopsis confluens TaxID=2823264 RepID=A0A8H5HZF6_9AGAR|nr:hypothetical protein D9757_001412 [Collybiopsis confluens]
MDANPESHSLTSRATKRKLDDAFESLDAAVASKESLSQPSPKRRTFKTRSIYSTLAKYGINSKNSDSSKNALHPNLASLPTNAPNLSAILLRAAKKTRKAFYKPGESPASAPPSSPLTDYRPSSVPSFLGRLETFKLATYANKPPTLDSVAAAKCGWINDGKDRLVCGICNASWVIVGKEGMSRDAANALIDKQRLSLVQAHKSGCPWRTRQCDDSIYRIPLQSPATIVQNIRLNAVILDSVLQGVEVKHPLTTSQLNSLQTVISSFNPPRGTNSPEPTEPFPSVPELNPEPSQTAIVASLFGWCLAPERPRAISASRPTSRLPSAARTPILPRASSVAPGGSPESPRLLLRTAASQAAARDTALLYCVLCQRRVGLWAFAPSKDPPPTDADSRETQEVSLPRQPKRANSVAAHRQFDLLKEHRSYCPFVVRSTVVPRLPTSSSVVSVTTSAPRTSNLHVRSSSSTSQINGIPSPNAMEGWRAVLTIVLRYRMSQRHLWSGIEGIMNGDGTDRNAARDGLEVDDGVEDMVKGVKAKGGSELLKYVKGLLG